MFTLTHLRISVGDITIGPDTLKPGASTTVEYLNDHIISLQVSGNISITPAPYITGTPTMDVLTDNTTGTPAAIIPDAGAAYSQAGINDIVASLVDQLAKARADIVALQNGLDAAVESVRNLRS